MNKVDERKRIFLEKLKSPSGKTEYKRYMGAPIRYAGGKSLAVGLIIERIPSDVKRVVAPFLGGGSVEVAIANELNIPVIGYDIFDILINYWDVQLNKPEALFERLRLFKPTRVEFKRVKDRLKKHWNKEENLNKLDLAAYYYFNHNTSYGPHFLGWPSSVYLQKERYEKMLERVLSFRAPKLEAKCSSFEDIMENHRDDFLYLDPPYYLDGDSKTFVGLYPHRNFPIHHKGFKHQLLHEMLLKHRGGFILSYNDCSTIKNEYKRFKSITPSWQYTFSQGDTRIGENRLRDNEGQYVKQSHELLIWQT
ncbi:restriction endonuclease [Candidatus Uhrbacteria bacterium RIFCSPHIGHO2_12_FULL_54_23]|uniref:site-specific DNA-methyltransferase (adenine-specific) n=3 Tax=Candidatus Uhriibacteriota TaxID=1752732 RepID=A0A1F7UI00_9BACT|nr:MAG: restriction endonuclease [Candidatus Uhrbacteria bacterium RIFCSPHIGHO2_12_FULL_54_23]OGL85549.1 MAG: restriction endonuclease [Candidatus Uhrbacteria bacterium RIFCSPLOWO2_01_FULL_55_36]OGL89521.1 MAG: restriction endonuclease [Candidatus Uhrbacteria bacterium RIFCSPLOWO2_02_FULL_54_37]OHD87630.1 MAG: restriction endonuclease [Sulfuricurvum sp. RIFCSPLOWO2_12_43_5]